MAESVSAITGAGFRLAFVFRHAIEVVERDERRTIRIVRGSARRAANGLEPAHRSLGETFGGARIVFQMNVDAVTSTVRGADFGDRPVCLPWRGPLRRHARDRAFGRWLHRFALADVDMMSSPVADALRLRDGALLINARSGRAAVRTPAPSLMLDNGEIERRARLIRPLERMSLSLDALAQTQWQDAGAESFARLGG